MADLQEIDIYKARLAFAQGRINDLEKQNADYLGNLKRYETMVNKAKDVLMMPFNETTVMNALGILDGTF